MGNQNTYIDVDLSGADDDSIRIATAGVEDFILSNGHIHMPNSNNSVYIGNAAGVGSNECGNVAVGGFTLRNVATNGRLNTAVGYSTLDKNTTGKNNTGVGSYSLANNIVGERNNGLGTRAGYVSLGGSTGTDNNYI